MGYPVCVRVWMLLHFPKQILLAERNCRCHWQDSLYFLLYCGKPTGGVAAIVWTDAIKMQPELFHARPTFTSARHPDVICQPWPCCVGGAALSRGAWLVLPHPVSYRTTTWQTIFMNSYIKLVWIVKVYLFICGCHTWFLLIHELHRSLKSISSHSLLIYLSIKLCMHK